eukprot:c25060_g1_i1 orf=525-4490(-)
MTAVAAVPVFSSVHSPARRVSQYVALNSSLHSAPSPGSSKFSALRLNLSTLRYRRRSRRRVAEARTSRFSIDPDEEELGAGYEGSEGVQFAGKRNASQRFSKANVQGKNTVSWAGASGASQDESNLSWRPPKHQARGVMPSDMRETRRFMSSENAHASGNGKRDTSFLGYNQEKDFLSSQKQQRSAFETQQQYGSGVHKKHPRVPLPTQNQRSRLQNRVSVFKGVSQPYISGLSRNNRPSWPGEEADDAPSNAKQTPFLYDGSRHNVEEEYEANFRHGVDNHFRKGTMFMSKLEEVCSNLKKKRELSRQNFSMNKGVLKDEEALRNDSASPHARHGSQNATSEGKSAQGSGVSLSLKRHDRRCTTYPDSDLENSVENAKRTTTGDDRQGDHGGEKYYPLMNAGKGSQSDLGEVTLLKHAKEDDEVGVTPFNLFSCSPSVPWEADKRYYSSTFKPHIPIKRGKASPSVRRISTSIGSRSSPSQSSVKSRNLSYSKLESQAAVGVIGPLEFGGRDEQLETCVAVKEGIETQGVMDLKDVKGITQIASQKRTSKLVESLDFDWSDSDAEEKGVNFLSTHADAEEVMPIESSSFASAPHNSLNCSDSGNEVDGDNDFSVLSDAEDDEPNSSERSLHNKTDILSSASTTYTEDTTSATAPTVVSSGAPDTCNGNKPIDSATAPTDVSPGAPDTSNGSKPIDSAMWHKHTLPDLPFEFEYSYSETPKDPILRYRETPYSPFGPPTMGRPWIGRPPLKPSKRKVREFDSFNPPPRDKKGVKFVQDPGPYPEGQGPKPAKSKEEIMGEPLTKEEIVYLVEKCQRENRQLNLGRDGLTHNMLDLIHSHWKRRRVCKIKCKGVPTVDMDNVKFHIEDKTGGKIIYHTGGVLYLFRGRNYNYKDRPQIPLMLWKPVSPVYPKLIQPAPEGLTEEEAKKLCRLGRKIEPICRLGKNGVYLTLVEDVRAAFKLDELVRIDCQGLNPSDYKKIGAKLRDLVPCVLLSFDKEQILMWRGKQNPPIGGTNLSETRNSETAPTSMSSVVECPDLIIIQDGSKASVDDVSAHTIEKEPSLAEEEVFKQSPTADDRTFKDANSEEKGNVSMCEFTNLKGLVLQRDGKSSDIVDSLPERAMPKLSEYVSVDKQETGSCAGPDTASEETNKSMNSKIIETSCEELVPVAAVSSKFSMHEVEGNRETFDGLANNMGQVCKSLNNQSECVIRVDTLWDHAFQSGMAIEITEADTDIDLIVRKAAQLAQSAPLGPTYTRNLMYKLQLKREAEDRADDDLRIQFSSRKPQKRQQKVVKRKFQLPTVDVPGMGGLPVDELAKLLAPK